MINKYKRKERERNWFTYNTKKKKCFETTGNPQSPATLESIILVFDRFTFLPIEDKL